VFAEEMQASPHGEGDRTINPVLFITRYLPRSQSNLGIGRLAL
jgi:hypothetical protein